MDEVGEIHPSRQEHEYSMGWFLTRQEDVVLLENVKSQERPLLLFALALLLENNR